MMRMIEDLLSLAATVVIGLTFLLSGVLWATVLVGIGAIDQDSKLLLFIVLFVPFTITLPAYKRVREIPS
jgi:hypothetical protein